MKIVISSGHGLLVRGADGLLDEVDEARRVVGEVAGWLRKHGHTVVEFHDDTSTTQSENLNTIVAAHNAQPDCDLNISVHFNAYEPTSKAMGTEVLYLTQDELAEIVSEAISEAGDLINRGAKYRSDLAFLNGTHAPAILIEVCFVDSEEDARNYTENFEAICEAIGAVEMDINEDTEALLKVSGAVSWFGGPEDMGVSPDEGLAFLYDVEDAPHLFLDEQPSGTTGLARRLDPSVFYIACRWDYDDTSKEMLAESGQMALVVARATGCRRLAWPADWGPHEDTNRVADVSPGLLQSLGIETDDEVDVIYPAPTPYRP